MSPSVDFVKEREEKGKKEGRQNRKKMDNMDKVKLLSKNIASHKKLIYQRNIFFK